MELQDFLSKLSLPQDFTRRGFLNPKAEKYTLTHFPAFKG